MMIQELFIATHNEGKFGEIIPLLNNIVKRVYSFIDLSETIIVNETGNTFEENAILKAETVFKHTHIFTLADDSGLEVDELAGAPGVLSARFAGENSSDKENNAKLLDMMKDIPESLRKARFKCVMALAGPDKTRAFYGSVEGKIAVSSAGFHGFGYDPLFIPAGFDRTFAELGSEIKAEMSHRSRALAKVTDFLKSFA